jgi:peptidoglycan/LPS O-acetylase OafA/YrhL
VGRPRRTVVSERATDISVPVRNFSVVIFSAKMSNDLRENFTLIQALRGLAALWVVLFHLEKTTAISGFSAHLYPWLDHAVFGYGRAGVAVFFVLSGFVIAHSLHDKPMSARDLGRFALRRSIRLDPPYWASMVFVVAVSACLALAHHTAPTAPGAGQVAAHVLYLQELLRVPEIDVVYWTLTYEIQFYLVYAASRWLEKKTGAFRPIYWALFLLALWSAWQGRDWALHGLFVNLWQGFFLGVLAYRAGHLRTSIWPFALLFVLILLGSWHSDEIFAVPCAGAGIVLLVAARANRLTTALRSRPWQGLGAISYSLYLVHVPTLRLLTGAWQRFAGRGVAQDTAAAVVLLAACLLSASAFFWIFERPSHLLAKRIFRRRPVKRNEEVALSSV